MFERMTYQYDPDVYPLHYSVSIFNRKFAGSIALTIGTNLVDDDVVQVRFLGDEKSIWLDLFARYYSNDPAAKELIMFIRHHAVNKYNDLKKHFIERLSKEDKHNACFGCSKPRKLGKFKGSLPDFKTRVTWLKCASSGWLMQISLIDKNIGVFDPLFDSHKSKSYIRPHHKITEMLCEECQDKRDKIVSDVMCNL